MANETVTPSVVDENLVSPGVLVFVLILTGLTVLATLLVAEWLRRHRKEGIVLSHQPIFLYTICAGLLIWEFSIIPLSVDDGTFSVRACDIACLSFEWMYAIGFTVVFAGLFSKLWRINRIFRSPQFRRIHVQAKDVMKPFAILFFINCTLLILITVLDPPRWVREPIYPQDVYNTYGSCQYQGIGDILISLISLVNLFAICAVIWQAYRARNISADFSETWPLAIVLLNWIQLNIIGWPTLALIDKLVPTAFYYLSAALILAHCCTLLLAIFCPLYFHPSIRNPPPALGAQVRVTGVHYTTTGTAASLFTESVEGDPRRGENQDEVPNVPVEDDCPTGNDVEGSIRESNSVLRKEKSVDC
jgi:hypothetical protein